jgi:hypothetical protein
VAYQKLELCPESSEILLDLLNAHVRVLGPDHPHVMECMLYLAHSYEDELEDEKAKDVSAQALELSTRVLGSGYPVTEDVAEMLEIADERVSEWTEDD